MTQWIDLAVMALLAVLYGSGMGGGGLLVVYLTLVRQMGQADAQALNLFFYIAASTASSFFLLKKRNLHYPVVLICSLAGIPGAFCGSLLRKMISTTLLRHLFGAMLVATGASILFSKRPQNEAAEK